MNFRKDNDIITVRPAELSDAKTIGKMYKAIAVTDDNYRLVLSDGEKSFSKRGGMFEIPSEEEIIKIIEDDRYKINVGEYNGFADSVIWYTMPDRYTYSTLKPDSGSEDKVSFVLSNLETGKLGLGKEIISTCTNPHIAPYALFCFMMYDYFTNKVPYMTGEVYTVNSYEDSRGITYCNLLNIPSFNVLSKSSGFLIGHTAPKTVKFNTFTVNITPNVFFWDTDKAFNTTKEILYSKGWIINDI